MIESTILILEVFALIFTFMGLVSSKSRMMLAMIGMLLCFAVAVSISLVEIPYIFYDETLQTVVSGSEYFAGSASLSYVFYGLGMFNFAIVAILLLEFITGAELTEGEIGG